ncbi:MAG: 2-dehydropantoate 2-reductase [Desulfococcaceae bacterium]|jgi:2-dehydropantoate 2-reductase|nr:2-dehydropantoate 2-reductase [Desulfococcaceae bacterium]
MMRIVIIGAGAMGSLFGAMLSPVSEVYLIDPYKDHVNQILREGLRIDRKEKTFTTRVCAACDAPEAAAQADLAIIFTKSGGTARAAHMAKNLLKKEGLVLTLQNGIGNAEIIAGIVGEKRALAGVTSHGGTLIGPGHVRHAGEGPTFISPFSPLSLSPEPVLQVFQQAGIEVHLSDSLDSLIWGKLIINVGINALAAILRVPNGALARCPECEEIMKEAVREALGVCRALHIFLPYDNPLEQVRSVCGKTAENRASMLQDILRGAETEISVINGAIVEKGEELGISTPVNRFLTRMVQALEATAEERIMA